MFLRTNTCRGFAPSARATMPSSSIISIMRIRGFPDAPPAYKRISLHCMGTNGLGS